MIYGIRDTGCTFVITESGEKAGIDFNFNGWGGKAGIWSRC